MTWVDQALIPCSVGASVYRLVFSKCIGSIGASCSLQETSNEVRTSNWHLYYKQEATPWLCILRRSPESETVRR